MEFKQVLQEKYILVIVSVLVALLLAWGLNAPLGVTLSEDQRRKDYLKTFLIAIVTSLGMLYFTSDLKEMDEVLSGQAPF
jgi:preprotein translocase subunit SecE